ncbi:hypothetical protein GCM10022285_21610 [Streptomyces tunisiensis]|uniref:Adenylate kinase n=1 Tax=Streptomyces tunisiensis TaxID=948699 RepID=A0ABP7Y758_9ACTN
MGTSGADQSGSLDHVGRYEEALARFADGLQELHIDCDAPAFRDIAEKAKNAGRVNLSVSAISEALSGRRLPSIDFTLELVRQLSGNDAVIQQKWRDQWRATKQLQRRAQPTLRERRRAQSARSEISAEEVEDLRTQEIALRREVERLQEEARAASFLISKAHADAERVIASAREEAARILASADKNLLRVRNHAAELLHAADEALGRSLSREEAPIETLRNRSSLRLVLLGPPGAGKGTQAAFLAKYLQVPHISLGDLLRHHIGKQTDLGRYARDRLNRGKLLEDELTLQMVLRRLKNSDAQRGFILDGLPRNVHQAALAADSVQIDTALEIAVPEQETLLRLTNRRVCTRDSSHVYHLIYNPNKSGDTCDICGAPIYLREDDSEGLIRQRLAVYRQLASPVVDFYKERGIVSTISGMGKVHEVTERAIKALAVIA